MGEVWGGAGCAHTFWGNKGLIFPTTTSTTISFPPNVLVIRCTSTSQSYSDCICICCLLIIESSIMSAQKSVIGNSIASCRHSPFFLIDLFPSREELVIKPLSTNQTTRQPTNQSWGPNNFGVWSLAWERSEFKGHKGRSSEKGKWTLWFKSTFRRHCLAGATYLWTRRSKEGRRRRWWPFDLARPPKPLPSTIFVRWGACPNHETFSSF